MSATETAVREPLESEAGSRNWLMRGLLRAKIVWALAVFLGLVAFGVGQIRVTTQHNDNSRTGQNTNETILTPQLLSSGHFGKLFSVPVDGYVYAQPLYVPSVVIPGKGSHNVIYVATEHDSVYALDADSNTGINAMPLWRASFIDPLNGITTVSDSDVLNCTAIAPEIGITSTPVIDTASNTIYVLAETKEHGKFFHRLHALDITTGAEKLGGPVAIQATYPGTGDGSSGGLLTFDPLMHLNRPALLLNGGSIYLAWSSNCDSDPYHGWVMAYDKTTLHQSAVWVVTANGRRGGIWSSGAGLTADGAGNLFLPTGNGTFETSGNSADFGDSILKMTLSGNHLSVIDYFTPYNQGNLDDADKDVGSGGLLLLPDQGGLHPHELIGAGKEGSIYVVDRDNMGHFNAADNSQIVQNITGKIAGIFGAPAFWNNNVYFAGVNDSVKAFSISNGILSTNPASSSPTSLGFPGATPVVSSNGTTDGVVWALQTAARLNDGNEILHAYDATNLNNELYNSAQNQARDNPGRVVKFAVPTVVNGKVYVGAVQQISVFGPLEGLQTAQPIFSPGGGTYSSTQMVSISDATPNATIYYTTDGSSPTTASPVYSGPIVVGQTTAIRAIAEASGDTTSETSLAVYTIMPGGGGSLDFGKGFNRLAFNGTAALNGSRLQLTSGEPGQSGSVWYSTPLPVQIFSQDFSFQLSNPVGDGMAFVIQNAGLTALGAGGGGLGYAGMLTSVAVKFDLFNNAGEGSNSTGLYINGASPTLPAMDMTASGINLHSGDVFNVHINYDGTTLDMSIVDASTQKTFTASWAIDIPATVGGTTAYMGFTGASGGATAIQEILTWTSSAGGPDWSHGFSSDGLRLNGTAARNGGRLLLTDGGIGERASIWYSTPVNIQAFAQDFSFQLTNPHADGIAVVIQNVGPTAVGSGGGGLGYGGMPTSIAIKFDLFNNGGEGANSTGLYRNGASPTVPALDMTASGIDLHSGDVFSVHMEYDGTTLTMTILDVSTQKTYAASWTIDIPATVGGSTAYIGFTGASGGATAVQEILNWTFVSPATVNYAGGFKTTGMALNGRSSLSGNRLRLTDGGPGEVASAWYSTKVDVQTFTQDFSFQMTNPHADGLTFAIQNVGTRALGGGGGKLGYSAIPASVAVKFDLYNNAGEGTDSTGLYTNGAVPTTPALDMTSSGVDLHSGHVFNVHMTYDGNTLTMMIRDASTGRAFQTSWPVNITSLLGDTSGYVGFTAATGGGAATQEVLSWTYTPTVNINYVSGFTSSGLVMNGATALAGPVCASPTPEWENIPAPGTCQR